MTSNWNIEKPHAKWEPPWATFPAEFIVSQRTKEDEAEVHLQLLENIQLLEGDSAQIYYTDGSQKDKTIRAGVCRLNHEGGFDLAKSWNLGTRLEVADAEVFAIAKALALALQNTTSLTRSTYIFVDSQAAIARLQNRKGVRTI